MKMSDVFKLPVYVNTCAGISNDFGDELAAFYSKCDSVAAANAINCHDELVQELQNVLDHHSDDIGHLVIGSIKEALKRARGEQ